jgi:toxin ParE1/3/4
LALSDLVEAEAFLRTHNPTAASSVMRRIETAIDRLVTFPESGRRGRVEGTRELVVPDTPFIVAYRLTGSSVDILSLVHSARRWPSSFTER